MENNLSEEAKKLILTIADMMKDYTDEDGNITQESVAKVVDNFSPMDFQKRIMKIDKKVSDFSYSLEQNKFESNNIELNNFVFALYCLTIYSLPSELQYDQMTLLNILGALKTVAFTAFVAGKVGLEKKELKDMLKETGFKEELEMGFDLEEWKEVIGR